MALLPNPLILAQPLTDELHKPPCLSFLICIMEIIASTSEGFSED